MRWKIVTSRAGNQATAKADSEVSVSERSKRMRVDRVAVKQ